MNFNTTEYSYNTNNENWRKNISFLFIGLMLNLFRIRFLGLDFILPIIGFILMFLGSNQLRDVNNDFHEVYYLVLAQIVVIILDAVIDKGAFLSMIFWLVKGAVQLLLLMKLRSAVFTAYRSVGREPSKDPFTLLMGWVVVTTVLNVLFIFQFLLFIPVMIAFVYLVYDFNNFRLETMALDITA